MEIKWKEGETFGYFRMNGERWSVMPNDEEVLL